MTSGKTGGPAGGMPTVLFHTRAASVYGWGHIIRSGRLADVLKGSADCRFVVEAQPDTKAYLSTFGRPVLNRFDDPVPTDEGAYRAALGGWRPAVVVFDMLNPNLTALAAYWALGAKIIVLSDEGHHCAGADVTLCPNPRELWASAKPDVMTGGLEYVLVPPGLDDLRGTIGEGSTPRLLVNSGGTTTQRTFDKMIEVLRHLDHAGLRGKYVLGYSSDVDLGNARTLVPNFEIVAEGQDMRTLVQDATFAFVTAGYIRYELAYLGLPMILTGIVDHQHVFGEWFAAASMADYAGPLYETPAEELAVRVIAFAKDRKRQIAQRNAGMQLIDGAGARRMADLVLELAQ
jgi:spore coat polysaccharide biosynthesis predicted glycosyltransferase SpsG